MNASAPDVAVAPVLASGSGSHVITVEGVELLDLAMGFGAAFLGHAHPHVCGRLAEAAGRAWSSGRMATPQRLRLEARIDALLPAQMRVAGMCSSGMEAAEFALRIAAAGTGRREFAAFARSMHGKSAMTAGLCWSNAVVRPEGLHTLPFVGELEEDDLLERLERVLAPRRVAALLLEPIQGSNAGHAATPRFIDAAQALCTAHGTLLVLDEILTGLYRTGPCFRAAALARPPDLMLFAKSMGNGFPVSALALSRTLDIPTAAAPGSTFSGNPLAVAAVDATLEAMAQAGLPARAAAIEAVVRKGLAGCEALGVTLRGAGALWCLELDDRHDPVRIFHRLLERGVLVTQAGRALRLLPAATIDLVDLERGCRQVAEAVGMNLGCAG